MSLKKNILANYISQTYVTLIGIVMVPLYIKYMGAEAYGLVGFFAMLQAWFNLMDMGLTPTMARETARYNGGAMDALSFRRFARALEGVFICVAVIGGAFLFLAADWIAVHWLKAAQLPVNEVSVALQFMAVIVVLRWMGGLYRGVISGSESLVWLSAFNVVISTLRFVGVLAVLTFIDTSPSTFFLYQFIVAIVELTGLVVKAYLALPAVSEGQRVQWTLEPLKPQLRLSLTIAFTTSVWVLITQTDKLVLSKILPLSDYGYFTLAVLVANGITIVGGPVSSALMPRMTNLEAKGKHDELIRLYRQSTQFVAVLAGASAITLALCSEAFLQAWTGNVLLASKAAPILSLYALGNGVLTVAAFPYYLQYAKGNMRLHLIGNALFLILFVPIIVVIASKYNGVGAGVVWLGMNLLSFFAWIPFVHRKFAPGLNAKWYFVDVLSIFLPMLIVGLLIKYSLSLLGDRLFVFMEIAIMSLIVFASGMFSSSAMRSVMKKFLSGF